MKNKLFLLVLPVFLALTGCSLSQKKANEADLIKEDTALHAEFFGDYDAVEAPMKMPARSTNADLVEPKVGVQFYSYKEDNKDYYAVRFVAAIASADVEAIWTRAVSMADSNQIKSMDTYESKSAYTSINDSGSIVYPYTISNSYSRFVVYTMYKIPASYSNYRIIAYVTLYDTEDALPSVTSKAVVTSVGGDHVFAVSLDDFDGKYFLEGTIGGSSKVVSADEDAQRGNKASFSNVNFAAGDKYGLFKLDTGSNVFQFFGNSTFFATASGFVSASTDISQYNVPSAAGPYTLFVSNGTDTQNFVYIIDVKTFTVTDMPDWTWNSTTIFAWVWDSNRQGCWKEASGSGTNVSFAAEKDIAGFLLVRCYEGTTKPNWDEHGDNLGRIYNKTGDITCNGGYSYKYTSWQNN